jgi:ABC-type anion transport system duplicated permease subunit
VEGVAAPGRYRRADLTQTINSILLLYSWIVVTILILFLFLIGRFYEIKLGQRSNYQLFLLPLVLFLVAILWYTLFARDSAGAPLQDFVGAFWPDLLYLVGGLLLTVLCYSLYRTMMGGKG